MSGPEIIKPPNTLRKAKIGNGPGKLDPNLLKKAEQAMSRMEDDYAEWAQEDLANLAAALDELRSGKSDAAVLKRMFGMALDMKGQGGSFGFVLITAIADSLVKFVEDRTEATEFDYEVISAHLGAMQAVFAEEIRGPGGAMGEQLLDGLYKLKVKAAG